MEQDAFYGLLTFKCDTCKSLTRRTGGLHRKAEVWSLKAGFACFQWVKRLDPPCRVQTNKGEEESEAVSLGSWFLYCESGLVANASAGILLGSIAVRWRYTSCVGILSTANPRVKLPVWLANTSAVTGPLDVAVHVTAKKWTFLA